MRRVFVIGRKPALWLFLGLFLVWVWFFHAELSPPPQHIFPTDAAYDPGPAFSLRSQPTWASVQDVSNDGSEVTIAIAQGDFRFPRLQLQHWDARTGTNTTP